MHALVDFLLSRIAEDQATLQSLDDRFGTRCVADCTSTRRIVELIGVGMAENATLAGDDVLLRLARVYSRHPDFRRDWRQAHG